MLLPPTVMECTDALPWLAVCNAQARARVYLHGAHVAAWRPVGEGEVLWSSVRSWLAPGRPIRGGVPICFPWFGPHPDRPELPAHGFARLRPFTLVEATDLPDGRTRIRLALEDDADTRALWPHRFALSYEVTVGAVLEAALAVTNRDGAAFTFEEALHTYFDVADVRRVTVTGLSGARYVDKTRGGAVVGPEEGPVAFAGETDRLYTGTEAACLLDDPGLSRRIRIEKTGSRSTVVWNPWTAKAARMPDFGDHEWPGMVCVETANAHHDRVTLGPGETHRMALRLAVERR